MPAPTKPKVVKVVQTLRMTNKGTVLERAEVTYRAKPKEGQRYGRLLVRFISDNHVQWVSAHPDFTTKEN